MKGPNVYRLVRRCVVLWTRPDQTEAGQGGEESVSGMWLTARV